MTTYNPVTPIATAAPSDSTNRPRGRSSTPKTTTPMTFSLLHATDFAHRLVHHILPPLKAGMIVLADRYVYTAFARDVVRGCDRSWVHSSKARPNRAAGGRSRAARRS